MTEPVPDHKPSQGPLENAQDKASIDQGIAIENVVLDPRKEAKLLLKLDLAFVPPIIMLTYLSCFLDRTNIGTSPSQSILSGF